MKKIKKSQTKTHLPTWRAVAVITWMVFMTAAVTFSLLLSWDSIKISSNNAVVDWPRRVRSGMEDTYRHPVVSAEEKLFVIPELNIALPYEDDFSELRYSSHTDENYQEATLTTSDIIAGSIQTRGAPDTVEYFDMPFFSCNQVLTIVTEDNADFGTQLDTFGLSDGRTLYAYVQDKNGADCATIYNELNPEKFLKLVKQARPYDL